MRLPGALSSPPSIPTHQPGTPASERDKTDNQEREHNKREVIEKSTLYRLSSESITLKWRKIDPR